MASTQSLREHVLGMLKDGGGAHLDFEAAVKDFPKELRGKRPEGAPHSPWELLEHLRITQSDILEFSRDPKHVSPEFPAGYWPGSPVPPSDSAWDESVRGFQKDFAALCALVSDTSSDLFAKIPHGDGQTLLREALLTADHNSYHLGQFVLVRRLLTA